MKHILVTGGAGFIGSHLCEALLSRGYAVSAMDNFVTGRKQNLEGCFSRYKQDLFSLVEADVSVPFEAAKIPLIAKHGLHGVLHFACPASPVDFDKIPFEILKVDSLGTMHTVNLAHEFKARYLVASTSEIYGDPLVHPQKEDYFGNVNSVGPRACYDEAKRFAEAYVSSAQKKINLNAGIVRIFNTYGPRMRPDDGRVVPELCMQALKGEALTLHGDGKQTRSFCYVSDLVAGIVKLFESSYLHPVNIGNPSEVSMLEFAEEVLKLSGSRSKIVYIPARPDDPRKRRPDISRAREILQWEPQIPLTEGLKLTFEHFRSQNK